MHVFIIQTMIAQ